MPSKMMILDDSRVSPSSISPIAGLVAPQEVIRCPGAPACDEAQESRDAEPHGAIALVFEVNGRRESCRQ